MHPGDEGAFKPFSASTLEWKFWGKDQVLLGDELVKPFGQKSRES